MASVDLREKPCKAVELWKVVAHHKLIKSRVMFFFFFFTFLPWLFFFFFIFF